MEYLKNGQIHTALTEGYSSEGYGVVRLDGAVVFVPRAVRGERIDLRITRVMKTHALGEIVKILHILALSFPCTKAYEVCMTNGPLFPLMAY